jgi:EAL domain-containing protein (putative c-di-GMP-specific phosphodiesterase class I)
VVRAIADLAGQLCHRVIAEGVESAEILQALEDADCDEAQGYWIRPALQGDRIPPWTAAWAAAKRAV